MCRVPQQMFSEIFVFYMLSNQFQKHPAMRHQAGRIQLRKKQELMANILRG